MANQPILSRSACERVISIRLKMISLAFGLIVLPSCKPNPPTYSAEDRRKGAHCIVPVLWYVPQVVEAEKARLRDPDSFQHDKTLIEPVDIMGRNSVTMYYRAKNGFGGYDRGIAVAEIDNKSCNVLDIAG